jgi:hypothetical protein
LVLHDRVGWDGERHNHSLGLHASGGNTTSRTFYHFQLRGGRQSCLEWNKPDLSDCAAQDYELTEQWSLPQLLHHLWWSFDLGGQTFIGLAKLRGKACVAEIAQRCQAFA